MSDDDGCCFLTELSGGRPVLSCRSSRTPQRRSHSHRRTTAASAATPQHTLASATTTHIIGWTGGAAYLSCLELSQAGVDLGLQLAHGLLAMAPHLACGPEKQPANPESEIRGSSKATRAGHRTEQRQQGVQASVLLRRLLWRRHLLIGLRGSLRIHDHHPVSAGRI